MGDSVKTFCRNCSALCAMEIEMDEGRMAALVQQYGTERITINSAADWGVSDPLKVPKTVTAMREAGISEGDIKTVVWDKRTAGGTILGDL